MDNEKVEAVGYEPPWGQVSWASWALFPARERISREDYEACSDTKTAYQTGASSLSDCVLLTFLKKMHGTETSRNLFQPFLSQIPSTSCSSDGVRESKPHHAFGRDVVDETWDLELPDV